ncbi:MAG: hypothetical protein WCP41_00660 [Verrucomicrobiota bacterium]
MLPGSGSAASAKGAIAPLLSKTSFISFIAPRAVNFWSMALNLEMRVHHPGERSYSDIVKLSQNLG